jgi:hypothetical protein
MRNKLYSCTTSLLFAITVFVALQGCSKLDKNGRLPIENLTSSAGQLNFSPMLRSDSASVLEYKPDTFFYDGKPYTGTIAQNENDSLATIVGHLTNGIMDSVWTFRYKSGGVRMQGALNNGLETGWWKAYYGYNKPKIEKLYDDYGYMLMRREYYDNGRLKNYQNIKCPQFGDRERKIQFNRKGQVDLAYVEDSLLQLSADEMTEKVGKNMFMRKH